jgi:hypothetical protein
MIKVISQFVKTDPALKWTYELQTEDFKNHMKVNYLDTGKLIEHKVEISPDNLTITHTFLWLDIESFVKFQEDPIVGDYHRTRNEYNEANGITRTMRDISQV